MGPVFKMTTRAMLFIFLSLTAVNAVPAIKENTGNENLNNSFSFSYDPGQPSNSDVIQLSSVIKEVPPKLNEIAELKLEKEEIVKEKESIQLELENLKQTNRKLDKVRLNQIATLNRQLKDVTDTLQKAQKDLERFNQVPSNSNQDLKAMLEEFKSIKSMIKSSQLQQEKRTISLSKIPYYTKQDGHLTIDEHSWQNLPSQNEKREELLSLITELKEHKNVEIENLNKEKDDIVNEKAAIEMEFEKTLREHQFLEESRLHRIYDLQNDLSNVEERLHQSEKELNQMQKNATNNRKKLVTFVSELEKLTTKMKESSNIPSHHEKSKIPALPDEKEVKEPAVTLKCRLCYKEVKELLGQSLATQSILSLLLG